MTTEFDGEFEGDDEDDATIQVVSIARGEVVNKARLCKILGKSDNTVSKWIQEGLPILRKGSRREGYEFDTAAVFAWHAKYAVHLATGDPDALSYEQAKRENLTAQARMRQLEFDKAAGKTIYIADLAALADKKFGDLRSRLLAIPATLTDLSDEQEVELRGAINDALGDVSSPAFWNPPDDLTFGDEDNEGGTIEDDSESG